MGPRFTHGPHAPAVGHLVEAARTRVYAAGDTDLYTEMAGLAPLDVALLPVWGWGTNLGPGHRDRPGRPRRSGCSGRGATLPVHWGTLAVPGLARTRRMRLLVEPPREFAAASAGQTEVLLTQPGEEMALTGVGR
jgi:L-ascorbate metabolism protein UlaG (beta-lactamase superfamily)